MLATARRTGTGSLRLPGQSRPGGPGGQVPVLRTRNPAAARRKQAAASAGPPPDHDSNVPVAPGWKFETLSDSRFQVPDPAQARHGPGHRPGQPVGVRLGNLNDDDVTVLPVLSDGRGGGTGR